ncbi:MAG: hypothetical protein KJ799_18780 [Bacteroidetes bacterium]|nr:hypothetical protein [Bacteroidota bacterium]MBU1677602.1 hypothetical protein [Bacteroidota bacterium]MBU2508743.1 hypothetical protein [Bacteroidota bacterium]
MKLTIFITLIFSVVVFAEHPDTTLAKLQQRKELIELASEVFDVDSKILSSIIYVERTLNYSWEDDAVDNLLAEAGLNSSIGFCQVKMKTAYWIEVQLNKTNSIYYPNDKYKGKLSLSKSSKEIIEKLNNDSLNIMYATAYLRIIINRWEKENYPIDNRADILGTLYSTGLFKRNGKERLPNRNPKANGFGKKVKESIKLLKDVI